jgi:hypothetical protein
MGKYQATNTRTDTSVFQRTSTPRLARKKMVHEYTLEGRWRASYSVRCETKVGRICGMKLGKMVRRRKMEKAWERRPWIVVGEERKERPRRRPCCFVSVGIRMQKMEEGMDAYVEGCQGEFGIDVCWGAPLLLEDADEAVV